MVNQWSKRRAKQDDEVPSASKENELTLDRALEMFLTAQDAMGHSKETQRDYRRVVSLFLRHMQSACDYVSIDQVTESDILDWLSFLRGTNSRFGRPYSSRSIQTYGRDVVVFFNWLTAHGHVTINPVALVKPPKVDKPLIRVFTEEELVRLDAACDRAPKGRSITPDERKALSSRDRAFLWLLLSTGVRVSEALGLLFSDVDWDNGMIYVRGKGAKERKIPIGKVARQHLNTYIQYWRGTPKIENDDHVFLNLFGEPMGRNAAQNLFARLKREAGITDKRVSAHTCRHWFAVNMIKRGMPSTVLQSLLGHERLEMINTYVRLAEQDHKELYARYSPVDALEMHQSSKCKREKLREWRNSRKKGKRSEGSPD